MRNIGPENASVELRKTMRIIEEDGGLRETTDFMQRKYRVLLEEHQIDEGSDDENTLWERWGHGGASVP